MIKVYLRQISLLIFLLELFSCSPGKVFKTGGNETKPETVAVLNRSANLQQEADPVMTARYQVNVSSVTAEWDNLCNGIVTVTVYGDFRMKPEGTIKCEMGMDIDASMLAKDFNIEKEKIQPNQFPQAGFIVRKPNPVQGAPGPRFDPPWPSSIGPLVQDVSIFDGYQYGEKTRVSGSSIDTGQPLTDGGAWQLTVLETGESYTSEENPELVYNSIVHWELKTFGFGLAPKSETGIFDTTEYWYNTRPIAIPKIVMTSSLKDLIPAGKLPGITATLGNLFIGTVKITLVIIDESRL